MDVDVPMEVDGESIDSVVVGNADENADHHVDDTVDVDHLGGDSREVDRLVSDKVLADTAITAASAIIATTATTTTDTVATDATSVGNTDVVATSGTTGNGRT